MRFIGSRKDVGCVLLCLAIERKFELLELVKSPFHILEPGKLIK